MLYKKVLENILMFSFLLLSCDGLINIPPLKKNEAPETEIIRILEENNKRVAYLFHGRDYDGEIDYIKIKFNDNKDYQNVKDGSVVYVPLIEGRNTVEAIAVDNEGLEDPTPARNYFVYPFKEEK